MRERNFSGRTVQAKAGLKRLIDAKKLYECECWRGSMYLAGYYIECKLKVRLMEMYGLWNLEQLESDLSQRIGKPINAFTHNIEVLMKHTGALERMDHVDRRFFTICNRWKTDWRYNPKNGSREECKLFIEAVEALGRFIERNS